MPPKKRGRKPKKKVEKGPPKKRGRKPKGGKIIKVSDIKKKKPEYKPNIILHLKTSNNDNYKQELTSIEYNPEIKEPEAFNINHNKINILQFEEIVKKKKEKQNIIIEKKEKIPIKNKSRELWTKLNNLKKNLKLDNISDKSSHCFWCTCFFDNPTIYIPKNIVEDTVEVYGCFCSPECALSFLKNEKIDTSTLWNRYSLLNNIYGKIYNYDKNIKPAPSPYYTLDKFLGSLTIQEYRKLLKNDRLILIVDKPLSKIMPEIYEENNEEPKIMNNLLDNKKQKSNKYKLKSKEIFKTKTDILKNSFNVI
uniref:MYM-type domain-containing protein n=1 Tax=viral metagenome TaxID=1070528 RepID=A0A6C0FAV8_9ZZZZ|tara:strand:- start:1165 stop:2088 length:924 start_codon:yes stop_codon:yes gene_type:complete